MTNTLQLTNFNLQFIQKGRRTKAIRDINLSVKAGKTLALVGESGCGKSITMQAVMGLLNQQANIALSGEARLKGKDLLSLDNKAMEKIRGQELAMIFQDPQSCLNPLMKIGQQIAEPLIIHKGMSQKAALAEAVNLLEKTRTPSAKSRLTQYPFELSGGMLQRVMIAMALACKPALLIADEPTTALDVTVQHQVLTLMKTLQAEEGMAMILITHDLGVVAQMADQVAVMYAGEIVEYAPVNSLFHNTAHPYTQALKRSMPAPDAHKDTPLPAIEGTPPDLSYLPKGCTFTSRCPYAMKLCRKLHPNDFQVTPEHTSRCWLNHSLAPQTNLTMQREDL